MAKRDRTTPYLALLVEKGGAGHQEIHAGLAKYGIGKTLCNDRTLFEFPLAAQDPNFAVHRKDGWRHRYAEAFLELNRGCPDCLAELHAISREAGWTNPKALRALQ